MSELDQSNSLDEIEIPRKKLKLGCIPMVDKISDLPWNILDHILYLLPIRDAVRTSILSKSWRYKWVTMSKLVFDYNCVLDYETDATYEVELMNCVYRVLLSHCGPIDEFKLLFLIHPNFSDLDRWINFLAKNGIRRLTLEYYTHPHFLYKLPSCIFSCQQLTHLCLNNCLLEPPKIFKGFSSLVSLRLRGFAMNNAKLERFVRSCPVLESLTLIHFDYIPRFNIYAPNLKYLYLDGDFGDICLDNCPLLADITFKMTSESLDSYQQSEKGRPCNLVRALSCLCDLQHLTVSNSFIKYLAMSNTPEMLHVNNHLKVLELSISSSDYVNESAVVLSLLKGFSNLKELYISAVNEGNGPDAESIKVIEAQLQSKCCFNSLHFVKFCISGYAPEVEIMGRMNISRWKVNFEFIKFLLSSSPLLEKMTIKMAGPKERDLPKVEFDRMFMSHLLEFTRASPKVVITYLS